MLGVQVDVGQAVQPGQALAEMDPVDLDQRLAALDGEYGRNKAEAMAERCRAINPLVEVDVIPQFLTASNMADLLDRGFDLVLDACDSFRVKVEMIAWCRRRKLPIVVSGSAGGRTDPTQIRLRELSRLSLIPI